MANQTTTMMIMIMGILLVFHIFGIIEQGTTPNSAIISWLINPENMQSSGIMLYIAAALAGVGLVGGAILGFITSNYEYITMAPLAIFLLNVIWDFLAVYKALAAENPIIATLLISPVFVMIGFIVIDWWRGRD